MRLMSVNDGVHGSKSSHYKTDYLFVKDKQQEKILQALITYLSCLYSIPLMIQPYHNSLKSFDRMNCGSFYNVTSQ